jgi:mannitol/fructose-specific phosphotransferase system IIA component (Ntr-type)
MLALEEPKSQIAMLKQIASVLQSAERVNTIVSAKTSEEVLAALDD